jgi:hypothetical protein
MSLDKAISLNELERVGFGLILLSKMSFRSGGNWEKIFIDMFQNINSYSKSVIK